MKKVFFCNSKGDKLCGIMSEPAGATLMLVLAHGFSSSKESRTYLALEKELNKRRMATLRFDFYGHGESEGRFKDITLTEAVDDILKAIEFVKQKGYENIGLVGSSFGGNASLLAAARTKDIQFLVLRCPVSNYIGHLIARNSEEEIRAWKEKGYTNYAGPGEEARLNYGFFEDAEKYDGFEAAKGIKVPTLIIHGSADTVVPVEQSKKTAALMPNCKLEVVHGANHRFTKHTKEMMQKILEFIQEVSST